MKRLSILAIALMVVGSFVLSSCRGAVYTAPLVPRFTPAGNAVTLTVYTNASVLGIKAAGSVDLTDLLGDAGFTANVTSVALYTLRTNLGATENNGLSMTISGDANASTYFKTVKQADAKVSTKTTVTYASVLTTANFAYLSVATNNLNNTYQKAVYTINVNVENGNNGYTLDDYSKLATTYTASIGNTP